MRNCLGVSVGATNLVAAGVDGTSTVRPASVSWRGTALTGFVERVGDPVPIIASDGSAHGADRLMVAALTELIREAGRPGESVGIALPAHWPAHVVDRMRSLLPGYVMTSDAVAALTALRAHPGLPSRGVVVVCDFGATGTGVTLADAAADFRTIGATVRLDDFSGDLIDRAVLGYLLGGLDVDPASTSAVAALTDLRHYSRIAKERLSFQSAAGLPGPVPATSLRLTRAELEVLVRDPLDAVLAAIDETMAHNGIRRSDLGAVASIGGGSRIPYVTQRLSEFLRMPVTTTPRAQSVAAIGAALIAGREPETATRIAVVPRSVTVSPAAAGPLAWSTSEVPEPAAYVDDPGLARPDVVFEAEPAAELPALAWYRRPAVLFAAAACAAILAATGLVVTTEVDTVDTASTATASAPAASALPTEPVVAAPAAIAGPVTETVVVTPPPTVVRYTAAPQVRPAPQAAPPVPTTQAAPTSTTPTTTTTAPTTTTTTTPTTTTTAPTTPATTTTTTPPPPTTTPPATTPPASEPPPPVTIEPPVEMTLPTVPLELPIEPIQLPITVGDKSSASR